MEPIRRAGSGGENVLAEFEADVIARLDLARWELSGPAEKKAVMLELFDHAKAVFGLNIGLFFTMPEGFELAYGLSNPATGAIHINEALWEDGDPIQPLFFFLHELRHSIQSSHPELFPEPYRVNARCVIQFDGTGYLVEGGEITAVRLSGEQGYFTELYLASPCERDANDFAYRCLKAAGAAGGIDEHYEMWSPKFQYFREEEALGEFMKVVQEIERLAREKKGASPA